MTILHIESSSKNCSVAVSKNQELLCLCEERSENYKQSENLHPFVSWALEGAGLSLEDIDAVCLGMGPGSYTGLRIGASSAKGFCFALNIPLIAVNSMETLVEPFLSSGYEVIVPLIDARRMEVYTAVYDGKSGELLDASENLILKEDSFSKYEGKKVLFVGDGALKAKSLLTISNADYKEEVLPSAQYLIRSAVEKFEKKEFEDIAYFEPFYLKDFQGVKKSELKK